MYICIKARATRRLHRTPIESKRLASIVGSGMRVQANERGDLANPLQKKFLKSSSKKVIDSIH